jgi:3-hydroxybutyryl-CoA dehydratase
MRQWRREAAKGRLGPGTTVRFSRTFTEKDVEAFGDITRDYNPVHYEPGFAEQKGFSGLVCHGLLVGSMICEPGGQWAWLASGMSFRFLKPVYIGDTITCEMVIQEVNERGRAKARASFTNREGQTVMLAELTGFLPSSEERALLVSMLANGDPTNPLPPRGARRPRSK